MRLPILFTSILTIILSSCSTYQIPLDSFEEQFRDNDPAQLNRVTTKTPAWGTIEYQTNKADVIFCVDKNNKSKILKKSPSLEIRITEKSKKKTVFYADQVFVRDSLICGERSRIINSNKCIPLKNVKLIEIQDGHKNYKYK